MHDSRRQYGPDPADREAATQLIQTIRRSLHSRVLGAAIKRYPTANVESDVDVEIIAHAPRLMRRWVRARINLAQLNTFAATGLACGVRMAWAGDHVPSEVPEFLLKQVCEPGPRLTLRPGYTVIPASSLRQLPAGRRTSVWVTAWIVIRGAILPMRPLRRVLDGAGGKRRPTSSAKSL